MVSQTESPAPGETTCILLLADDAAAREEISGYLSTDLESPVIRAPASTERLDQAVHPSSHQLCIISRGTKAGCLSTVEAVRRHLPECPILVILELDDEDLATEVIGRGVDRYIIKTPGYVERLRAGVTELLESAARRGKTLHTLQVSSRQFQDLVESSAQGILVQVGAKPVYANGALARMLGYERPEDVLNLDSVYELVDARDRNRVRWFSDQRASEAESPELYVFRARRRDGTLIWLENRVDTVTWQGAAAGQCTLVDVSDRQRATNALRLASKVASKAGAQPDFDAAIRVALKWLARGMGWDLAESWLPSTDGSRLDPGPTWLRNEHRYRQFTRASRGVSFKPGDGLPGRVWEAGRPEWIENVSDAPRRFRRSIVANECGLMAGCGIPITSHGETIAVLCFFTSEPWAEERGLIAALSAGTASLGPVLLQIRTEQARRASIARMETLISDIVDGIVVVDEKDRILFANPAAEEAFGRRSADLRGLPFGAPFIHGDVAEIEIHNVNTGVVRKNEMRVAEIDWNDRPARLVSLRDATKRIEAQETMEHHRAALQERIKELNCLYTISGELARGDIPWRQILERVVAAIPGGLQYPEQACARLRVEGLEVSSGDFQETEWKLSGAVELEGELLGRLDVCYNERKFDRDEGPFLDEEKNLIDDIVRRIGQAISTRRFQQELDFSRRRFQDFAEAAADWLWEMDEDLRFTYFSERIEVALGLPVDHWIGKTRFEITPERVAEDPKWAAHRAELEARQPFKHLRYQILLPDGTIKHISISGVPVFDDQGVFRGYRGTGTDESGQVEATHRALESDQRLSNVADRLPGIVFQRLRKPDGTVEYPYLSAGMKEIFGYEVSEVQEDPLLWSDLIHPEDRPQFDIAVAESRRTLEPMDIKLRMLTPHDGGQRWLWHRSRPRRLENGDVLWDCIELDITEQKQAEARIQYLGYHDQLTRLPNRDLFVERVSQVLPIASRNGEPVAVAMLGLKRFKQVNEEFGMSGGDEVLRAAAARFKDALRPGDTVARLGGDRFLFLMPSVGGDPRTQEPLERLSRAMEQPFSVNGRQILLTFNMGVALFPDHGASAQELIQKADTAQAHYSRWGPGFGYTLYQDKMPQSGSSRLVLEKELSDALEAGDQLKAFFQPLYDARTGQLIAVETLARWMHPQRGIVPPGEFIHLAEETGLINPVGREILRQACTHAREWEAAGLPRMVVAVNLSARQIRDTELAASVHGILSQTGMPPDRLMFEVTESTLIADLDRATELMQELGHLGVRFALDDFGVGYSSLSYLGRLPVQALKIDRSFIRDLQNDPRNETTIKGIVALAHALGLHVVAEGVETREQMEHVKRLGCDTLQGFWFARPMPAMELEALLAGPG